jgi:hypothetical protein
MAYNGASIGGVVFSPLWVTAIAHLGFGTAALVIAIVTAVVVWWLADTLFSKTPSAMGMRPDGTIEGDPGEPTAQHSRVQPLPRSLLWRDWRFLTLAAGMALGLFAQIGLLAHLFSFLVPPLGAQLAGLAMAVATGAAIAGRMLGGWVVTLGADRRLVAAGSYGVQIVASVLLMLAAGENTALLLLGALLFGSGIGNATSLPPLIAQVEFNAADVARVVALIVAMAQGAFAFAPVVFGIVRDLSSSLGATSGSLLFVAAATIQAVAALCFLAGRR